MRSLPSLFSGIKIGIITSRGGHLFQMYRLRPWWKKYSRFWVAPTGSDVSSLLGGERVYTACFPDSRNFIHAIKNFVLAWRILLKEKPSVLVSCGAGVAPPFYLVGKVLGIKLIFIEPYDFISHPSLSGRMLYGLVDHFLVQHRQQMDFFKDAEFHGSIY